MGAIVVVGAARTPVGAFNGAFASVAAHENWALSLSEKPWLERMSKARRWTK